MPATLVEIGAISPRTSAGASGLGSQVECCGGPPIKNSRMHDFALPPLGRMTGAVAASAFDARSEGSVSPSAPSPPTYSASRRETPSQRRAERDRKTNIGECPGRDSSTLKFPQWRDVRQHFRSTPRHTKGFPVTICAVYLHLERSHHA